MSVGGGPWMGWKQFSVTLQGQGLQKWHSLQMFVLGLIMSHLSQFVTKDHACNMIDSLYDVVGDLSAGDTQRSKNPNL